MFKDEEDFCKEMAMDKIENHIIAVSKEYFLQNRNSREFSDLYKNVDNNTLKELLAAFHYDLNRLFRRMNERLPTGEFTTHFWADESRELLSLIEWILGLQSYLFETKYQFEIVEDYEKVLKDCRDFLCKSGGSEIPAHRSKIEIIYNSPIFIMVDQVKIVDNGRDYSFDKKPIGEGSYAIVYKYKDSFYGKSFVIKQAKKDLDDKEMERFHREYQIMKSLSSPYIVEVYNYDEKKQSYIMEYMDYTLFEYIKHNNNKLEFGDRKGVILQIMKAFLYIHKKNILHRDISPYNVLVKNYDDGTNVIKVSDFGLVKIPDSNLTSMESEIKGAFCDPSLRYDGFANYNIFHEIYALTLIVYYVMTGRTNISNINKEYMRDFVIKGTNPTKEKRFASVNEMIEAIRKFPSST